MASRFKTTNATLSEEAATIREIERKILDGDFGNDLYCIVYGFLDKDNYTKLLKNYLVFDQWNDFKQYITETKRVVLTVYPETVENRTK